MATQTTTKIDLHLPRGWQNCTTKELEIIAAELIRANLTATRLHPFDWAEVKTRLFFALTGVEVVGSQREGSQRGLAPAVEQSETQVPVPMTARLGKQEFPLEAWQVHSFIEQHLSWIDATDKRGNPLPMPRLRFPYPTRFRRWWPISCLWKKEYLRPGELLDGMTWQTYRWINDWMEEYQKQANALVEARAKARRGSQGHRHLGVARFARFRRKSQSPLTALAKQEAATRTKVVALIFGCSERRARRVTEIEWQVLMFWWSSMMQYLREQYPKCFREPPKPSQPGRQPRKPRKSAQQPLPIELYTRSMATLQKYLGGLTEEQINAQTAHAILRHLNDMAVEAEEMEKLKHKNK